MQEGLKSKEQHEPDPQRDHCPLEPATDQMGTVLCHRGGEDRAEEGGLRVLSTRRMGPGQASLRSTGEGKDCRLTRRPWKVLEKWKKSSKYICCSYPPTCWRKRRGRNKRHFYEGLPPTVPVGSTPPLSLPYGVSLPFHSPKGHVGHSLLLCCLSRLL